MSQLYMLVFVTVAMMALAAPAYARPREWVMREGKLHVDGRPVSLKIGKPLRNFADPTACEQLIRDLVVT